jgi:hypothetical protein
VGFAGLHWGFTGASPGPQYRWTVWHGLGTILPGPRQEGKVKSAANSSFNGSMGTIWDELGRRCRWDTNLLPQNMQFYADVSAQHAQDVQKLAAAFQTLYASFSDERKKTADEVFRHSAEHGHHQKNG